MTRAGGRGLVEQQKTACAPITWSLACGIAHLLQHGERRGECVDEVAQSVGKLGAAHGRAPAQQLLSLSACIAARAAQAGRRSLRRVARNYRPWVMLSRGKLRGRRRDF